MEVENLIFNVRRTGDTAARGTDRLSNSLQRLRKSSEKAHQGVSKLASTFRRMTKLMLLRQAIRALIKEMEEGLKSAYAFNSMAGGEMSAALDALKSAAVQTTGALGSAFGEMIANVAPILISLLNLIGRVANAFSQLMAVLGGRSTYTKAIASSEKWAESTASGAKAAKEWKNQLMGFDEINRLEEPSDSSGGGGGSAPYDGAFELAPAENAWAAKLRALTLDWWNSLDLEPITKAWDRLSKAVKDFVSIVDDALYWAYTEVLLPFGKWTIEKGLPASLELVASLFETINATLRVLAPLFLSFFNSVIKPVAAFVGDVFVKALQWLTLQFEQLTQNIQSAKSLGEFIKSLGAGEAVLVSLATAVAAVATAFMAWRTVISIVNTVGSVIGLLSNPVGAAIVIIGLLVMAGITLYQNWDTIKEKATEVWETIKTTWSNIKTWVSNSVNAVVQKFEDFMRGLYEKFVKPLLDWVDSVKEFFGDLRKTISDSVSGFINNLFGFSDSTVETKNAVVSSMGEMSASIFDVYNNSSLLGSLASAFENLASRAHAALQDIITGLGTVIGHCIDALHALNDVANTRAAQNEANGSQYLTGFASGGFPDEGQLFMAREGGMPELVGKVGNHTAVANNDQIVAGISNGVYNAVVSAMSISGGGGSNTPVEIYLDGNLIAKSTTKYQRQYARAGTM